jgi:peptidoglycan/LPS O-acetylase OafA/YrhL
MPTDADGVRASSLPALTGLRFVATALVVVHHLAAVDVQFLPRVPAILGNLGVTFFFVLSGFILAYKYTGRLADRASVGRFWRARIARVWPLHMATLGVSAIYLHGIGVRLSDLTGRFLINASLLHAWVPNVAVYFSFNGPSWSISVEAFFYLLFPVLLAGLMWLRATSALKAAALLWAAAVATLIATLSLRAPDPEFDEWAFYIAPVWRLSDFVIGVALGVWFVSSRRDQALASRRRLGVELAALAAPAAVATGLSLWVSPEQSGTNTVIAPAVAVTVYGFAVSSGPITTWLAHPLTLYLGEISYGVYMWHALLIGYAIRSPWFVGNPTLAAVILVLATIAVSSASYHLLEQPLRRLITGTRRRDVTKPKARETSSASPPAV